MDNSPMDRAQLPQEEERREQTPQEHHRHEPQPRREFDKVAPVERCDPSPTDYGDQGNIIHANGETFQVGVERPCKTIQRFETCASFGSVSVDESQDPTNGHNVPVFSSTLQDHVSRRSPGDEERTDEKIGIARANQQVNSDGSEQDDDNNSDADFFYVGGEDASWEALSPTTPFFLGNGEGLGGSCASNPTDVVTPGTNPNISANTNTSATTTATTMGGEALKRSHSSSNFLLLKRVGSSFFSVDNGDEGDCGGGSLIGGTGGGVPVRVTIGFQEEDTNSVSNAQNGVGTKEHFPTFNGQPTIKQTTRHAQTEDSGVVQVKWNAVDVLYHDVMMNVLGYLTLSDLAAFSTTARRPNGDCFYFFRLQLERAMLVSSAAAKDTMQKNKQDEYVAEATETTTTSSDAGVLTLSSPHASTTTSASGSVSVRQPVRKEVTLALLSRLHAMDSESAERLVLDYRASAMSKSRHALKSRLYEDSGAHSHHHHAHNGEPPHFAGPSSSSGAAAASAALATMAILRAASSSGAASAAREAVAAAVPSAPSATFLGCTGLMAGASLVASRRRVRSNSVEREEEGSDANERQNQNQALLEGDSNQDSRRGDLSATVTTALAQRLHDMLMTLPGRDEGAGLFPHAIAEHLRERFGSSMGINVHHGDERQDLEQLEGHNEENENEASRFDISNQDDQELGLQDSYSDRTQDGGNSLQVDVPDAVESYQESPAAPGESTQNVSEEVGTSMTGQAVPDSTAMTGHRISSDIVIGDQNQSQRRRGLRQKRQRERQRSDPTQVSCGEAASVDGRSGSECPIPSSCSHKNQKEETRQNPYTPMGCVGLYVLLLQHAQTRMTQLIQQHRLTVYQLLSEEERRVAATAFVDACTSDENLRTVQALVRETGVPVNAFFIASDGTTETCGLHAAAFHGASAILDFLCSGVGTISANDGGMAHVDLRDDNGWTALHFAAGANSVKAVQVLARHGADLIPEAGNGYTPYHWAERLSNEDVANELRKLGADDRFLELRRMWGGGQQRLSGLAHRIFRLIPTNS